MLALAGKPAHLLLLLGRLNVPALGYFDEVSAPYLNLEQPASPLGLVVNRTHSLPEDNIVQVADLQISRLQMGGFCYSAQA